MHHASLPGGGGGVLFADAVASILVMFVYSPSTSTQRWRRTLIACSRNRAVCLSVTETMDDQSKRINLQKCGSTYLTLFSQRWRRTFVRTGRLTYVEI